MQQFDLLSAARQTSLPSANPLADVLPQSSYYRCGSTSTWTAQYMMDVRLVAAALPAAFHGIS